jgi:hypothetical protein
MDFTPNSFGRPLLPETFRCIIFDLNAEVFSFAYIGRNRHLRIETNQKSHRALAMVALEYE